MTEQQPISAPREQAGAPESAPARRSKGEKFFDLLFYGGMNYVGTFALTVVIADFLKSSGAGKKFVGACEDWMTRRGFSKKTADSIVTTSILMPGGSLMIAPVHLAEKHRTSLVAKFNSWFGDTTDKQEIAREEPQQTWGSLIKGRLVAWCMVFAGMFGAASVVGEERFENYSKRVGAKVAKTLGVAEHLRNDGSRIYRYGTLGALDAYATALSVSLLYVSSKFFAQRREEHLEYQAHHTPASADTAADVAPAQATGPQLQLSGEREARGTLVEATRTPELA